MGGVDKSYVVEVVRMVAEWDRGERPEEIIDKMACDRDGGEGCVGGDGGSRRSCGGSED